MNNFVFRGSQNGATIIAVLMVLLILTVVGTLAIRTAMTNFNLATNAQVGQLSSQTADTPFNQFLISDVLQQTNLASVIGKALKDAETDPGREYVFCYKPKASTRFGSAGSMAVNQIVEETNDKDEKVLNVKLVEGSIDNFCDLDSDFGSAREAIVTQVAVKIPTDSAEFPPLALLARETNVSGGQNVPQGVTDQKRIRVTTVAVMPVYATDRSAAQNCLIKNINDDSDEEIRTLMVAAKLKTSAECLVELGIPVNTQVQEFNLQTFLEMIKEPT